MTERSAETRVASNFSTPQLTQVSPDVAVSRIEQIENLVVGTVAGWEAHRHRGQLVLPLTTLQAELVRTATAVVTAPPG